MSAGIINACAEALLTPTGQDPPHLHGQPDAGLQCCVVLDMACVENKVGEEGARPRMMTSAAGIRSAWPLAHS